MGRKSPVKPKKLRKKSDSSPPCASGRLRTKTARAEASMKQRAMDSEDELFQSDPGEQSDMELIGLPLPSKAQAKKPEKPALHIRWTDPRIERTLDWLETHVQDRQKLFSDSSQDAAEQGRKKLKANGSKSVFYVAIAKDVFAVDEDKKLREAVTTRADDLGKSVENMLGRYVDLSLLLVESGLMISQPEIHLQSIQCRAWPDRGGTQV